MAIRAPSRQALQHLSHLCHSIEQTTPASRRALCTHTKYSSTRHHAQRIAKKSSTPIRSLTASHRHNIQPNESHDSDPQNAATPVLPDITNYYTLFPSTIPNGPPGPTPRTQSTPLPSSSTTTPTTSSSDKPTFAIHLPTLRKEFLRLQSTHHPDKYATGSTVHQKALALSSLINTAYKTLSDPLLRAQYLLLLHHDIDVTSEDNAAHPTDQDTLMEVMEAQERTENATSQDEIEVLKDENRERIARAEREVGEAFEVGDVERAKDEAVRLKYWRSLQGGLDDWEEGKEVRLIH